MVLKFTYLYKSLKTVSVDDVAFVARRPKGALAFKALPSEHHFAQDGRKRPCIGRVCGHRKEVCRSAKHCQSSLGGHSIRQKQNIAGPEPL